MSAVERLVALKDADPASVGTKMANLGHVARSTPWRIPDTVVLPTSAYDELLPVGRTGTRSEEDVVAELGSRSAELLEVAEDVLRRFAGYPIVVRSSATVEDTPLLSFAGQYASFLKLREPAAVVEAIKKCYASLASARAQAYAAAHGVDLRSAKMAIGFQPVLPIVSAGVVFRLNPVTSDLRQIVVEHVDGLGTAVVNGEVGVRRNLLDVGALPGADGLLGMVGRMSVEVSSAFGAPQDIEWGFDGREIIVFQARPITATGRSEVPSARDPGMPLERRTVGIPAFRGYGAGTLMAVDRQTDLAIVPDGAILLLRGADVGMEVVPALRRARGLLVGGGILSHIAVVAREYRVPCLAVDRSGIDALDDCLGREVFLDAVEGSVSLMCPPPL